MYQLSFVKWNSGPMEDDLPAILNQKDFSSNLVRSLCGTFTNRKPQGRPSSVQLPLLRTPGHESVNVTKNGVMKRGRCHECSIGPNKKMPEQKLCMAAFSARFGYAVTSVMTFITCASRWKIPEFKF